MFGFAAAFSLDLFYMLANILRADDNELCFEPDGGVSNTREGGSRNANHKKRSLMNPTTKCDQTAAALRLVYDDAIRANVYLY